MKHFADISSDTPFSIELKAPPMDTFHNKGTGTLILKDGAYSDGDVRVTADGPVICGPITCRDLYISATSDKSFHADQQFTCRDMTLHAKANASIDLTGGITCRPILFLRNRHPHGQVHKGRTGQCVARKHRSRRAASHGCHSHGDRRRDGQLPCHPQDRGGGERHGQHILQRTSAHRLQDTLGKRPH